MQLICVAPLSDAKRDVRPAGLHNDIRGITLIYKAVRHGFAARLRLTNIKDDRRAIRFAR